MTDRQGTISATGADPAGICRARMPTERRCWIQRTSLKGRKACMWAWDRATTKSLAAGPLEAIPDRRQRSGHAGAQQFCARPQRRSAVERMRMAHVMDWLVNPNKKQQPGNRSFPDSALKDGERHRAVEWAGSHYLHPGDTMAVFEFERCVRRARPQFRWDGDCICQSYAQGDRFPDHGLINNTLGRPLRFPMPMGVDDKLVPGRW